MVEGEELARMLKKVEMWKSEIQTGILDSGQSEVVFLDLLVE